MTTALVKKILSTRQALLNIGKTKVLAQLRAIFSRKYLQDCDESDRCTELVNVVCFFAKSDRVGLNMIGASTDIRGAANGGTPPSNSSKSNLQLLVQVRPLFAIAVSLKMLNWLDPVAIADDPLDWVEYYIVSTDVDGEVIPSGWWIDGPQRDITAFISASSNARRNALRALRRARASVPPELPQFAPQSSWPAYLSPILLKNLFTELGADGTAAVRRALSADAGPLDALVVDAVHAAPHSNLSAHTQAMLGVTRTNQEAMFRTTFNSGHPAFKLGQFQSGLELDECIDMAEKLAEGSEFEKKGQGWGKWYFSMISTPATNADARYNAVLESTAAFGKLQNEVVSLKRYIRIGSRLISFMLLKGHLDLPDFDEDAEPTDYFELINAAVLLLTVSERFVADGQTFLRLQLMQYKKELKTFEPVAIATISATLAGLSSTGKLSWKANYVGMRDSSEILLEPRDRPIAGLTTEFSRKIYDGEIQKSSFMGGVFTLLAQCAKFRDTEAPIKFVPT